MKIKKIYVATPGDKDNGGGESLHQLVDACNRLGYDAYIYYLHVKRDTVLEKMKIYNIQVATDIEDVESNLLICPEMLTYPLKKYRYIRKGIWFLSLDYYLRSLPYYRTVFVSKKWNIPSFLFPITFLAVLVGTNATFKSFDFAKDNICYFLYNVEYAREYIEEKCCNKHISQYLCGPINNIYFEEDEDILEKEYMVAYNPRKATDFTQKIINSFEQCNLNIKFVPIQNLEQHEVKAVLKKAAVYMDFGYFPGPERIPREAVMMKCNIVTSNLGSAANEIDVPIDSLFKFSLEDSNIESIVALIKNMIISYEKYVPMYEKYRMKVKKQKKEFDENVRTFLERIESNEM